MRWGTPVEVAEARPSQCVMNLDKRIVRLGIRFAYLWNQGTYSAFTIPLASCSPR